MSIIKQSAYFWSIKPFCCLLIEVSVLPCGIKEQGKRLPPRWTGLVVASPSFPVFSSPRGSGKFQIGKIPLGFLSQQNFINQLKPLDRRTEINSSYHSELHLQYQKDLWIITDWIPGFEYVIAPLFIYKILGFFWIADRVQVMFEICSYEMLGAFTTISKHDSEENRVMPVSIDWQK